ncbi:MAG TPA: hypothetical protein VFF91_04235 [Pseudoxanthomonas sp.]|nr:hypothetical protein [Pseudoxanthomonas sp.]
MAGVREQIARDVRRWQFWAGLALMAACVVGGLRLGEALGHPTLGLLADAVLGAPCSEG